MLICVNFFLTFSDPPPSNKIRRLQKERPTTISYVKSTRPALGEKNHLRERSSFKSMKGKKPLTEFDHHPKKTKRNGKSNVTSHKPHILRNVQVVLERCRVPSH